MKVQKLERVTVEAKYIKIDAPVFDGERYIPADFPGRIATVTDGRTVSGHADATALPDRWVAVIDIDERRIVNWPVGYEAEMDMRVADEGNYTLYGEGMEVLSGLVHDYVPDCLGGGKYLKFSIDGDGRIDGLKQYMRPETVAEDFFPCQ